MKTRYKSLLIISIIFVALFVAASLLHLSLYKTWSNNEHYYIPVNGMEIICDVNLWQHPSNCHPVNEKGEIMEWPEDRGHMGKSSYQEIPEHIDGVSIGGITIGGKVVSEEIWIPVKSEKNPESGCTALALMHMIKYTTVLEPPLNGHYVIKWIGFPKGLTQEEFDQCLEFILEKTNQKFEVKEKKTVYPGMGGKMFALQRLLDNCDCQNTPKAVCENPIATWQNDTHYIDNNICEFITLEQHYGVDYETDYTEKFD